MTHFIQWLIPFKCGQVSESSLRIVKMNHFRETAVWYLKSRNPLKAKRTGKLEKYNGNREILNNSWIFTTRIFSEKNLSRVFKKITKFWILEMGEAEKISSLLAISAFLMWPILFSGSSLFFSERQKDQLSELGKVKASLWRLGKISNFLTNFFWAKIHSGFRSWLWANWK